MQQRILVYGFRTLATLLLLLSSLSIIAVRLSDKGDIVDRNQYWILLCFVAALGIFISSILVSDGLPKRKKVIKTTHELTVEIRKSNLNRIKVER